MQIGSTRFGMTRGNWKVVPADPFNKSYNSEDLDKSVCREAVGTLMNLMACTRPGIAFADPNLLTGQQSEELWRT